MSNFFNLIKSIFNISDEKKHKIAKIISLLVGACFDFIGIICVIIWKYLFCSKDENSKYCIRLSILGFIIKCMICAKFAFWTLFYPSQLGQFYPLWLEKKISNNKDSAHEQDDFLNTNIETIFVDDDFFNFNLNKINSDIKKIHDEFFTEQKKLAKEVKNQKNKNRLHYIKQRNFENNISNNKETVNDLNKLAQQTVDNDVKNKNLKNVHVKKEVKTENGYQITTIEKKGQNFHQKNVYIKYIGNKDVKNKKNNKKKELFNENLDIGGGENNIDIEKKQVKQKHKKKHNAVKEHINDNIENNSKKEEEKKKKNNDEKQVERYSDSFIPNVEYDFHNHDVVIDPLID